MRRYFVDLQPKKEDGSFNQLQSIENMGKLPVSDQHDYESLNIGHCFHSKLNFTQVLRHHQIENTPAN